jgi:hypothetical protein
MVPPSADDHRQPHLRVKHLARFLLTIRHSGVRSLGLLSLRFGADGWQVVTGSADSTLKLWDRRKLTTADGSPSELHVFLTHNQAINTVEWSPVRGQGPSPQARF